MRNLIISIAAFGIIASCGQKDFQTFTYVSLSQNEAQTVTGQITKLLGINGTPKIETMKAADVVVNSKNKTRVVCGKVNGGLDGSSKNFVGQFKNGEYTTVAISLDPTTTQIVESRCARIF